jgi:ankyrin repeat protein
MEGFNQNGNVENRGIIPRAIEQIFGHIQRHASPRMRFLVRASYLQIYNEQISDLLKPERSNLAIREDKFDAAVILINTSGVDVNLGGGIFGSPMHLAVVKLEVWIVKKLLMKGADVNKADCDGNTPLHLVMNVFSKNS